MKKTFEEEIIYALTKDIDCVVSLRGLKAFLSRHSVAISKIDKKDNMLDFLASLSAYRKFVKKQPRIYIDNSIYYEPIKFLIYLYA